MTGTLVDNTLLMPFTYLPTKEQTALFKVDIRDVQSNDDPRFRQQLLSPRRVLTLATYME